METDYSKINDELVAVNTGKPLAEWMQILCCLEACKKCSDDFVVHLQHEFKVPRFWARRLTMRYLQLGLR
ncbi:MAG: hypothetical protein JWM21_246 [Acidobacteria bacterium]|nr:hypothetical protein [Acidobacteriota bacterium]